MQEEPDTCGQGLAANAVVPERMAALLDATANVLQNHIRSLNPADAVARLERNAYEHIISEQRGVASKLSSLARAMRSYRDLPMAAFVDAEEGMLTMLQENVRSDRDMLGAMLPT
jgi:hypothetical protein